MERSVSGHLTSKVELGATQTGDEFGVWDCSWKSFMDTEQWIPVLLIKEVNGAKK